MPFGDKCSGWMPSGFYYEQRYGQSAFRDRDGGSADLQAEEILSPHVILADECPALEPSMVLGEQLTTVGKTSLKSYVGRVSSKKVHEIEKAVEAHLGLALSSTG